MLRRVLTIILLGLGSIGTSQAADKWLHAQSPHFEMFSAANAKDSRELLSSLELFRQMFLDTFSQRVERNPKTTIVLFNRDRDFDRYKPVVNGKPASMGGVCINLPDGTFIALSSSRETEDVMGIIFHEYVHQLMGAMGTKAPAWLNEGLAEVFQTFFIRRDSITLGKAQENHVLWLRQRGIMPLSRLLAVTHGSPEYTERDRQGQFYATAWLMVHYCIFGKSSIPPRALSEFMNRLEQQPNAPLTELFVASFGFDLDEMETRLKRYLSSGRYTIATTDKPETWPGKDVEFTPADPFAVELALLQLKVRLQRDPAAAYQVRQHQLARPDDPRPYEMLGTISQLNKDHGVALDHWQDAVERGTTNAYYHVAVVERAFGQWLQGVSLQQSLPPELADRWRASLERALTIDPGDHQAILWLAWLEAFAQTPALANANLVQKATGEMRQKSEVLLALAVLRNRMGDTETAAKIVNLLKSAPLGKRQGIWKQLADELGVPRDEVDGADDENRPPKLPRFRQPTIKPPGVTVP